MLVSVEAHENGVTGGKMGMDTKSDKSENRYMQLRCGKTEAMVLVQYNINFGRDPSPYYGGSVGGT